MFDFKLVKNDEYFVEKFQTEKHFKDKVNSLNFDTKTFNSVFTKHVKTIIGREEMLFLIKTTKDLNNYNIISITEPFQTSSDLSLKINCNNLIQLEFTDIRQELSEKDKLNPRLKELSLEHIEKLKNFILENKDKPFLINCDAGISRSAAIAIYVETLLNNKDDISKILDHFRYSPNQIMLDKMDIKL